MKGEISTQFRLEAKSGWDLVRTICSGTSRSDDAPPRRLFPRTVQAESPRIPKIRWSGSRCGGSDVGYLSREALHELLRRKYIVCDFDPGFILFFISFYQFYHFSFIA